MARAPDKDVVGHGRNAGALAGARLAYRGALRPSRNDRLLRLRYLAPPRRITECLPRFDSTHRRHVRTDAAAKHSRFRNLEPYGQCLARRESALDHSYEFRRAFFP